MILGSKRCLLICYGPENGQNIILITDRQHLIRIVTIRGQYCWFFFFIPENASFLRSSYRSDIWDIRRNQAVIISKKYLRVCEIQNYFLDHCARRDCSPSWCNAPAAWPAYCTRPESIKGGGPPSKLSICHGYQNMQVF